MFTTLPSATLRVERLNQLSLIELLIHPEVLNSILHLRIIRITIQKMFYFEPLKNELPLDTLQDLSDGVQPRRSVRVHIGNGRTRSAAGH